MTDCELSRGLEDLSRGYQRKECLLPGFDIAFSFIKWNGAPSHSTCADNIIFIDFNIMPVQTSNVPFAAKRSVNFSIDVLLNIHFN